VRALTTKGNMLTSISARKTPPWYLRPNRFLDLVRGGARENRNEKDASTNDSNRP
jgi:hypothetical protein